MSKKNARAALITLITGVPLNLPVFHENREAPDLDKVPQEFLEVVVDFNDSHSADLKYMTENLGILSMRLWTRRGAGVVTELDIADTLDLALSRQVLGGVTLGVMTPGRKTGDKGWRQTEWLIPFSFYS